MLNSSFFARAVALTLLGGSLLFSAPAGRATILYSCAGSGGGDLQTRGFYMTNFPGTTMDSATLKIVGYVAGTYQISLTARSGAYNGPILGSSTNTVTLNGAPGASSSVTFTFPDIPMPAGGTVCFNFAVLSGPSGFIYYDVGGGCPGVIETEDTSAPLSTFRFLGVALIITGSPQLLYSCGPGISGDLNYRGFYMTNFPGAVLDAAYLNLVGTAAGTYQISLTALQGAYNGPVLGVSTVTATLNSSSGAYISTKFPFPDISMPQGGTVCFVLNVLSGPGSYVYYSIGGGCPEVIETEDTTPPLSTFRRLGVELALYGTPGLRLNITRSGSGAYVFWQNVPGWTLEQNPSLYPPAGWSPSSGIITLGGSNYFNLPSPTGNLFFRLKYP